MLLTLRSINLIQFSAFYYFFRDFTNFPSTGYASILLFHPTGEPIVHFHVYISLLFPFHYSIPCYRLRFHPTLPVHCFTARGYASIRLFHPTFPFRSYRLCFHWCISLLQDAFHSTATRAHFHTVIPSRVSIPLLVQAVFYSVFSVPRFHSDTSCLSIPCYRLHLIPFHYSVPRFHFTLQAAFPFRYSIPRFRSTEGQVRFHSIIPSRVSISATGCVSITYFRVSTLLFHPTFPFHCVSIPWP